MPRLEAISRRSRELRVALPFPSYELQYINKAIAVAFPQASRTSGYPRQFFGHDQRPISNIPLRLTC